MDKNSNLRLGITLMIATTFVFAVQDGLSRKLVEDYNAILIVMIRYWFFAVFVVALSSRQKNGLRRVTRSQYPILQIFRGLLLVAEIVVMVISFNALGLVPTHAIFVVYPLLIAALSGPILGENVGWRSWLAILIGFVGVLIILRPGFVEFSVLGLLPLLAAFMFALYGLLTRLVAQKDTAQTSFFWTGVAGAVAISLLGPFYWQSIDANGWVWLGALCLTGVTGHYLLIKTYDLVEASSVQPFAYFQLVFVSFIGVAFFNEEIDMWLVTGAGLVIGSGLFTYWRAYKR